MVGYSRSCPRPMDSWSRGRSTATTPATPFPVRRRTGPPLPRDGKPAPGEGGKTASWRRPRLPRSSSRSTIGAMADIRSGTVLLGALLWTACGRTGMESVTSAASVYEHPRQPSLAPGSDHYTYYEGAPGQNACARDQDCVISGCADSTCAAEVIAIADKEFCENLLRTSVVEPPFSRCGCLAGECRWYFESDYDRTCASDSDCAGLGPPPEGVHKKAAWNCSGGRCQF
jgi:hypothetical protein